MNLSTSLIELTQHGNITLDNAGNVYGCEQFVKYFNNVSGYCFDQCVSTMHVRYHNPVVYYLIFSMMSFAIIYFLRSHVLDSTVPKTREYMKLLLYIILLVNAAFAVYILALPSLN